MSTLLEDANRRANEAAESLRRAEEYLRNWRVANPQDVTSPVFLLLSAEVTARRARKKRSEQTLQAIVEYCLRSSAGVIGEQRITLQEYLQTIPPLPNYSNSLPDPTSEIPPGVRHPQITLHWESFEQEVMDFVRSEIEQRNDTVQPPVFEMRNTEIRSEVPALQMFISQNYLEPIAIHFGATVITSEYGNSVGKTDSHVRRNGRAIIVNEYKGKWTLDAEWFQNGRIDQPNINSYIRNAVVQLYTYMVVNHLQYGILTSSNYTFFFKRVKVENADDELEQLLISTAIAHDSTNPTLFQSLAYIFSIADGTPFTSPPPSPLRQSIPADVTHDSIFSQNDESYESEYALEDFSIKSVLGYGRTKVYYEAKNQLALKAIDLWKQSHMISELQHEVKMYQILSDLQGKSIPRLVLHGYWEGGLYCLGFSLCGTIPDALSKSQKQSLLSTLDAIHNRGVIHNDIKKENILVDENGTVFLIDFGFATMDSCPETQQNEKQQLLQCIERL